MTADKKFKRLVRDRARRTGESYAVARHWLLRKHPEESSVTEQLIPVRLAAIKRNVGGERNDTPVVDLAEIDGDRHVYIFVGQREAEAMAHALEHTEPRRPLPHDLLSQTLDALGGDIDQIVIRYQPDDSVFTAEVLLTGDQSPAGASIDARPSDALALAVRRAPVPTILVESSLLHQKHPSSDTDRGS